LEELNRQAQRIFDFLQSSLPDETFNFISQKFSKLEVKKHKFPAYGFERG